VGARGGKDTAVGQCGPSGPGFAAATSTGAGGRLRPGGRARRSAGMADGSTHEAQGGRPFIGGGHPSCADRHQIGTAVAGRRAAGTMPGDSGCGALGARGLGAHVNG
jgi:hypothetical protein